MALVDWFIVIIIALAVLEVCSRAFSAPSARWAACCWAWSSRPGTTAGWRRCDALVRIDAVADAIGFLLIALLVMAVTGLIGSFLGNAMHQIGLGCLDKLAGAAFGFFQGMLLVTVIILVAVAFFPRRTGFWMPSCPGRFSGPVI